MTVQNATAEKDFWNQAATDPDYMRNYIADPTVSLTDCINQIEPALQGKCIFDLGCGPGRVIRELDQQLTDKVFFGIDTSIDMIEKALEYKSDNVVYKICAGSDIPLQDDFADSGYSMFMFQHITSETKARYLSEIERVLLPGGVFVLQYVEGDEASFMKHDAKIDDMRAWCAEAGLVIKQAEFDKIVPRWTWLTLVKEVT